MPYDAYGNYYRREERRSHYTGERSVTDERRAARYERERDNYPERAERRENDRLDRPDRY